MSIPRQYAADTPLWYDRRMPTLEDFDGDEAAFDQAFAEYVNQINGPQLADTPNFGIPEQEVVTFNPDGTTSTATRGGLPDRFEGMSAAELAANQLNARFDNIAKKQNAGMYSPEQRKMDLLALHSRAQVRPEEMQQAYQAVRADGTPVLADPVLAYLEQQFGYLPGDEANFTPPVPVDAEDALLNDVLGTAALVGEDEMGLDRLGAITQQGQMMPDDWQRALIAYQQAVADGVDPNIALTAILFGGY